MRICSLVPGATEIVFALGLGDQVVGVTHECDWPPEATARPAVTASLVETDDLSSVEIDRAVSSAVGNGRPLYAIDEEAWREIDADVVLVQELCDVCAVSRDEVHGLVTARSLDVEIVDVTPSAVMASRTPLSVVGETSTRRRGGRSTLTWCSYRSSATSAPSRGTRSTGW